MSRTSSPAPEFPASQPPLRILLRADATSAIGVGHAMRLLALAQELIARGHRVDLAGALEIDWVAAAYERAGIAVHDAPGDPGGLAALAAAIDARVCILDRYDLPAQWGRTLRQAGIPVVAMVDGEFSAHQEADLYVDQNPGSHPSPVGDGATALAGASYTLFRDDVLALRRTVVGVDAAPADGDDGGAAGEPRRPLRVLAVFGGTDPMGAAPVVTPLLVDAARRAPCPVEVTVVTPDASWADAVSTPVGVSLRTTGALSDLAAHAVASDLVVTASGSSVWELLCLGVPIGVVCVIDNQAPGYEMVVADDLAVGVGHLAALRADEQARRHAVERLSSALDDPSTRLRRARRGQALLDGRGRCRVADAVEALAR